MKWFHMFNCRDYLINRIIPTQYKIYLLLSSNATKFSRKRSSFATLTIAIFQSQLALDLLHHRETDQRAQFGFLARKASVKPNQHRNQ